jgi:hypothetical protein
VVVIRKGFWDPIFLVEEFRAVDEDHDDVGVRILARRRCMCLVRCSGWTGEDCVPNWAAILQTASIYFCFSVIGVLWIP